VPDVLTTSLLRGIQVMDRSITVFRAATANDHPSIWMISMPSYVANLSIPLKAPHLRGMFFPCSVSGKHAASLFSLNE
jgi:hypothetical protein